MVAALSNLVQSKPTRIEWSESPSTPTSLMAFFIARFAVVALKLRFRALL